VPEPGREANVAETIKVRVQREGDRARVKCLIVHPMETGLRKDPLTGATVPRHHITRIIFANSGRTVMVVHCSTAVAKNPYLDFSFQEARAGDRFSVTWVDTRGETDSLETVLQ
jgi:sulfur-oxidizing protein SoxZ